MVSTTPPVTTTTLFSRYSPTPLSMALAKLPHRGVSGSDHGLPKISRVVLVEASSAQANGTTTVTVHSASTTCAAALPRSALADPWRPCSGRRAGAAAGATGSCFVSDTSPPSVLDLLAP